VRAPGAAFKPGEGPGNGEGAIATQHAEDLYYSNLGVMLRAYVPITAWLEGYAQADLNVLSLFDIGGKKVKEKGYVWTSPLRAGLNVNATDRVYLRAHGSVNGFGAYALGWQGEVGVRF
jgi:hypothetical protein